METNDIVITKYFKTKENSALVAIFSCTINLGRWGKGYMNDCKIFQKNGHMWIKFPDKEYTKDGEKKYMPLFGLIEKKDHEALEKEVLKAIREYDGKPKSDISYPNPNIQLPTPPPPEDGDLPF